MTQNSNNVVVENDTAANVRSELNEILEDITTLHSGVSEPSTTYANMLWYDTDTNILKMRAEADDAWINVGYLDQSADAFRILDDTQVVSTSGTQTGLLGDQSTATWEAGTSTTESLVSPAKVKAAIEEIRPTPVMEVIAAASLSDANPVTENFSTGFASITRVSNGVFDFVFSTARSSLDYTVTYGSNSAISRTPSTETRTVNGFRIRTKIISSGSNVDQEFDIIVHALPS